MGIRSKATDLFRASICLSKIMLRQRQALRPLRGLRSTSERGSGADDLSSCEILDPVSYKSQMTQSLKIHQIYLNSFYVICLCLCLCLFVCLSLLKIQNEMPAALTTIRAEFGDSARRMLGSREATELGDRAEADDGHGCQGGTGAQAVKNVPMQCPWPRI